MVYFVPSDRRPLVDWRERVDYFRQRIQQFHQREFGEQSRLNVVVHPTPLISELTTDELRKGDADRIYYRTLSEADRRLSFATGDRSAFPILLVLSEINWRPLDDFYRLRPDGDSFVFEGNNHGGQHFPGAASGGARAAYLADRGVGWGLVSADGWRVPYRGSDCVIYHEGCGHTVGLPHPEPGNGSVMSLGQYRGWISESWLDKEQKIRLGWEPQEPSADLQTELFSKFTAIPEPLVPKPSQAVFLRLQWPDHHGAELRALRVRYQTSVAGPWIETPQEPASGLPERVPLGSFERETPVSYRIDVQLKSGETAELWGYLQIRAQSDKTVQPAALPRDLIISGTATADPIPDSWPDNEIDLLKQLDLTTVWKTGDWSQQNDRLQSPKAYGARLQLPFEPPQEYRLTAIVQPLDEPNGLLLGHRSDANRFVTLFNYATDNQNLSAIENIDGRNVGNESTFAGKVFQQNQLSQVVVTVRKKEVTMAVDGRPIVRWAGSLDRLSLSDYWKTPNESAIFIGAYDCRYVFHRLSLQPLK